MSRTFSASANSLFQKMQIILENRATPVVEAHRDDFYELDRETLQSMFAPGIKLLWLLHPHGTHLGEVGILHPDHSQMNAALKTYSASHAENRMELHLIEVMDHSPGSEIKTNIRQISLSQGLALFRPAATRYAMRGDALTKDGASIASISVKFGSPFGLARGFRTHIVSEAELSKIDAIAASLHAGRMAAERSGMFMNELGCVVNGRPFEALYPAAEISSVAQGQYAYEVRARERQAA